MENSNPITPMKLIKLCYIAQGVYLVARNERLFNDELEAWKYGPVVPSLYHEFKRFGDKEVTIYGGVHINHQGDVEYPHVLESDVEALEVLNLVWDQFKDWTASQLSAWTHRDGSAWQTIKKRRSENQSISDEMLKTEFEKIIILDK